MRPVGVILLSVLLVMVSLCGGFVAGGYMARMRADGLAHHTLRNLGIAVVGVMVAKTDRGESRGMVWPAQMRLPLGVVALYDSCGEDIPYGGKPAVPVGCISPGYDPDTFIVLFSDTTREKLNRAQLEDLLGVEGFAGDSFDLRGFH